jgi:signal transduction histidine kinase/ActR/RegA family two-component response regulator
LNSKQEVYAIFYQTKWFYTLCVIGIILLIVGMYQYRLCKYRRREQELLLLVDERTKEVQQERALLAQKVEERTTELRKTNDELARTDELKDEFLAAMSHELRTPLNAILGLSEAIMENIYGPINEQQHGTLKIVEENGRHLLNIINDMLDLSKIKAGQLQLITSEVNVHRACLVSFKMIEELARKKKHKIFLPEECPATIHVDERKFKQIMVNLLSNAVKFTLPEGNIGIDIKVNDQSHTVDISVWDTGIGIATEDLPRLFTPFVQLDSKLSRKQNGTGLGLTLVKQMVEMHGGQVSVESQLHKGSRFTISFQQSNTAIEKVNIANARHDNLMNSPYPTKETDSTEEIITHSYVRKNEQPVILLAEDNDDNIVTFSGYLTKKGYKLNIARNSEEAISIAKVERPDLILMDVQMPGMDGLEAIQIIKADKTIKDIPIIALTALAMSGDREKCLSSGASLYLQKPVSLKKLAQAIEEQLNCGNHHMNYPA